MFGTALGVEIGFDPYDLDEVIFQDSAALWAEQLIPLFTGVKRIRVPDNWEINKHFYIVQNKPYPCTIRSVDLFGETSNE